MITRFENFVNESYRMHAHISNNSDPSKKVERKISFTKKAFEEFNEMLQLNKNDYKKVVSLINDMARNPELWRPQSAGLGRSEHLKGDGRCSKRINKKVRLEYKVSESEVLIYSCIDHYGDT